MMRHRFNPEALDTWKINKLTDINDAKVCRRGALRLPLVRPIGSRDLSGRN